MRTVRTVAELRGALSPARSEALTVGLVPTMGALHEGHLSLIDRAREQCDLVVVSLFVNPTQFNQGPDLERYPRREQQDATLAAQAGADLLFVPSVGEVYPPGFATYVQVEGLTDRLEGAARGAEHFRGVCTIVAKLLCMCGPDVAYFGQKDAQQVLVIRRMVSDLNLPVRIEACPTVREPDGLARSSRNVHLSRSERARAVALYDALASAGALAAAGERSAAVLVESAASRLAERGIEPEYLTLSDPDTLTPLERLDRPGLLTLAARVGETRLIDNVILNPLGTSSGEQPEREAATRCSV